MQFRYLSEMVRFTSNFLYSKCPKERPRKTFSRPKNLELGKNEIFLWSGNKTVKDMQAWIQEDCKEVCIQSLELHCWSVFIRIQHLMGLKWAKKHSMHHKVLLIKLSVTISQVTHENQFKSSHIKIIHINLKVQIP